MTGSTSETIPSGRSKDGFLRAEIQAQNQWSVIFERYQLIAYPGPYNDFTITLETVGADTRSIRYCTRKALSEIP